MTDLRAQLQSTLGTAYTLERELGGGGMSRVFLAQEHALTRDVVVKVIRADLAEGVSAERFAREVKLAARLQQANIVPVLSAGNAAGLPYYTMPFVKGESLRARLASGPPLSSAESIGILRDVARALAYAHTEGVVHRDIKPENVLLSGGAAVVTDFGIAKAMSAARTQDGAVSGELTQAGLSLGTPAYMAPEQALGDPNTDHRADLYAWGVIAYELLAGAHPFAGRTTTHALISAHVTDVPPPLSEVSANLPASIAALVMRTLEKDPAQRPQSAHELLSALEVVQTPAETPAPRSKSVKRLDLAVRILVATATLLTAVLMVWFIRRDATANPSTLDRSVIVLPFENASRDTAQEFFADGLTDELMGRLAAAGLRVTGRNTAFAFKGKHPTAREVGKVADVATVLSGQVRRLGEQMHVTAELSNTANDAVLWTYTRDSRTADAFAVQRELVDSIIARFELAPKAITSSEATDASVSTKAHEYYLRAKYAANDLTLDGLQTSLALYDSALAIAPRYSDAVLGKANSQFMIGDSYESPRLVLPRVQAILADGARIDSARSDYLAAQAIVGANWIWNWDDVRVNVGRARALDPYNFNALFSIAAARLATGDGRGFVTTMDTMQRSDPLSPLPTMLRLHYFALSQMRDSTRALWERTPEFIRKIVYGEVLEGMVMLGLDRNEEAERAFRTHERELGHPSPLRAVALARLGRKAEARTQLNASANSFDKQYSPPELIAAAAAELGDTTTMYRWLDRGVQERSAWVIYLGFWNGALGTHRGEPHFQRILRSAGLTSVH